MKSSSNHTFINWGRNILKSTPLFAQPESEAEIVELIRKHRKIRVVGTGHSWSALCESEELLINLDHYNKILTIDKKAMTATVQAGIKLHQLNELLDKEGLALINLGSIAQQSVAGAISTGTHGSGIGFQCLASQVLEFTLIKADGEKIRLKQGEELFQAAIVNLGCLGLISEMTLQIRDAFQLHDQTYTLPFDEVIEHIDEYIYSHDHFKLWWLPPSKDVVVFTYKRTQEPRNDSRLRQFFKDELLSVLAFRTLVKVGNLVNKWRPAINRLLTSQMKGPLDRIEKSYRVFNVPEPPVHRETEWAFDVSRAKELLGTYREAFSNGTFTFNFIQEIRFTKGDDFWLSECYGRDSIWIGAYNHEDKQWPSILEQFERFAKPFEGRPHWGKEFNVRRDYLETQYPKYADFMRVKKELDPEGKFSNALTDALFV